MSPERLETLRRHHQQCRSDSGCEGCELLTALTEASEGAVHLAGLASDAAKRIEELEVRWDDPRQRFEVEVPCDRCGGRGRLVYGDTSTWRRSGGGQTLTTDVCDGCWGSGEKGRAGVDLRKMEAQVPALTKERDEARAGWQRADDLANSYCSGMKVERAARQKAEEENRFLREALWLGHGHNGGALYGDDGEMQCNAFSQHGPAITGPVDFKRDGAERCRDAFLGAIREQFQETIRRAQKAEERAKRLAKAVGPALKMLREFRSYYIGDHRLGGRESSNAEIVRADKVIAQLEEVLCPVCEDSECAVHVRPALAEEPPQQEPKE